TVDRTYFYLSLPDAAGLRLGEGVDIKAFPAEAALQDLRMVPYDAFALWMHHNRARIGRVAAGETHLAPRPPVSPAWPLPAPDPRRRAPRGALRRNAMIRILPSSADWRRAKCPFTSLISQCCAEKMAIGSNSRPISARSTAATWSTSRRTCRPTPRERATLPASCD